jgi:hypothetical protein
MEELTFIQGEAAARLTEQERVKWVRAGMHVLRQRRHGGHKWKAVTADWQIKEAKRQKVTYVVRTEELARLWHRRIPAKVRQKLIEKKVLAALAEEA